MLGGLSAVALVAELVSAKSPRLLITGLLFAGCVSLISISPLGRLSGAHLNPAVTLAFHVMGMVRRRDVAGYVAAQLAGALAGSLVFRAAWGPLAGAVGGGVTHTTVTLAAALALEAGMTALLVATIFAFTSRERLARWTPLAIWPLIGAMTWQIAPYTGTSLNPARSEGPAVAFGDLAELWLYAVAPTLGALAVGMLWRRLGPSRCPRTAKLFHDPAYASCLGGTMPARVAATGGERRPHEDEAAE